jgi:hypothetical protein
MTKTLLYTLIITALSWCSPKKQQLEDENTAPATSSVDMNQQKLRPEQYVTWIQQGSNGLKKEKTINDIIYSAQYKPLPYIICEEERTAQIADSTLRKKTNQLGDMQYYNFKIELKEAQTELIKYGISTTTDYAARVNYFSFDMQRDIKLVQGGDTLPCLLYHYERVYNTGNFGMFSLGFAKGKALNDRTLIFFDHGFNKGIIKFFFAGTDIKNQPQLETI